MNRKYLLILCFFLVNYLNSQVRVGDFRVPQYGHSNISKSILKAFKDSKTYFVVNDKLGLTKQDFNDILKGIWTITPFEVVSANEESKYLKEGNSLVYFESFTITREKDFIEVSVHSFTVFDVFLLKNIKRKKNGEYKFKRDRLAALYFTIDVDARKDVVSHEDEIKGDIFNYRKGYLKNSFQNLNKRLISREAVDIYDDYTIASKVKILKKQPLYFSEELIYGYDAGFVSEKKAVSKEELFKDYKFDYKIISDNELNEKILKNQESFYYLLYSQINSNKILNIIDSKTGEAVLQEHKKMSYNLKAKDLKQLSKTIEKAK